jgi:hypothetical protein
MIMAAICVPILNDAFSLLERVCPLRSGLGSVFPARWISHGGSTYRRTGM